jgi:hypothetical protein
MGVISGWICNQNTKWITTFVGASLQKGTLARQSKKGYNTNEIGFKEMDCKHRKYM